MFNDIVEAEKYKDSIMGIMRSAMVCLYVLLKNDRIVMTSIHLPKTKDMYIKSVIVDNIESILFLDDMDVFRKEFIASLSLNECNITEEEQTFSEANMFAERLEIARNLPKETKDQIKGLLSMLSTGEKWFVDWLWSFMEHEHEYTQEAGAELICDYFPWLDPDCDYASDQEHESINYYSSSEQVEYNSRFITFSNMLSCNPAEPSTNIDDEPERKRVKFDL